MSCGIFKLLDRRPAHDDATVRCEVINPVSSSVTSSRTGEVSDSDRVPADVPSLFSDLKIPWNVGISFFLFIRIFHDSIFYLCLNVCRVKRRRAKCFRIQYISSLGSPDGKKNMQNMSNIGFPSGMGIYLFFARKIGLDITFYTDRYIYKYMCYLCVCVCVVL